MINGQTRLKGIYAITLMCYDHWRINLLDSTITTCTCTFRRHSQLGTENEWSDIFAIEKERLYNVYDRD